jgi:CheY-like chemotaxis protein
MVRQERPSSGACGARWRPRRKIQPRSRIRPWRLSKLYLTAARYPWLGEAVVRIALVDPSRTVQRIVSGIIEPWGHEVRCFIDGPQALTFLQADPIVRALISSVELASYSGMRLVRESRLLAGTQRPLYIVIMSSSAERSKMIEALENALMIAFLNLPRLKSCEPGFAPLIAHAGTAHPSCHNRLVNGIAEPARIYGSRSKSCAMGSEWVSSVCFSMRLRPVQSN